MKRTIVAPAVLSPAALSELKQWLAITTAHDDGPPAALLGAALDVCEGFTGAMPLEAECEELLPACGGWQRLCTRPVQAITGVEGVTTQGERSPLTSDAFAIELDADGGARVRVTALGEATRIAVRFVSGLEPDWESLPHALRHGIVRLAAHQHRERDGAGAAPLPPAAIAALWKPWRRLRLA